MDPIRRPVGTAPTVVGYHNLGPNSRAVRRAVAKDAADSYRQYYGVLCAADAAVSIRGALPTAQRIYLRDTGFGFRYITRITDAAGEVLWTPNTPSGFVTATGARNDLTEAHINAPTIFQPSDPDEGDVWLDIDALFAALDPSEEVDR